MSLRCKFRVSDVQKSDHSRHLVMVASNQKDGDNKDWSKWTPTGELKISVSNESAFEQIDSMKPGDHFYIDISPVGNS